MNNEDVIAMVQGWAQWQRNKQDRIKRTLRFAAIWAVVGIATTIALISIPYTEGQELHIALSAGLAGFWTGMATIVAYVKLSVSRNIRRFEAAAKALEQRKTP